MAANERNFDDLDINVNINVNKNLNRAKMAPEILTWKRRKYENYIGGVHFKWPQMSEISTIGTLMLTLMLTRISTGRKWPQKY